MKTKEKYQDTHIYLGQEIRELFNRVENIWFWKYNRRCGYSKMVRIACLKFWTKWVEQNKEFLDGRYLDNQGGIIKNDPRGFEEVEKPKTEFEDV